MRFVVFAMFAAACTNSSTGITQADITCDSSLTYANFGESFISEYCGSCHAGKQSPNLSTQAGVQANSSRIIDEAVYSSNMPEDGSLTTEQRTMLGQWLECGAP